MYILLDFCQKSNVLELINFILKALHLICVIAPIILIVLLMIDFIKGIMASEEEIRKIFGITIKRIIYCALIFFVPMIVNVIVSILGDLGVNYMECIENATDEKIAYYKSLEGNSSPSPFVSSSSTSSNKNKTSSTKKKKEKAKVKDIEFKITKDNIVIGHYKNTVNKYTIVLKGNGKILNNKNYKFTSSNPAIASVNYKGEVTGNFGGKTTITVTSRKDKSNSKKVPVLVTHSLYTYVTVTKTVTGESAKTGKKVKLYSGTKGLFNGIGPNTMPSGYLLGDTIKVNGDYIKISSDYVKPYKYYVSDIYYKEDVEEFVNNAGFESNTNYLLWSNSGTGMEYMFKGKKGKWKLYKQFYINVGDASLILHPEGSARTGVHFDYYLSNIDYSITYCGYPVVWKRKNPHHRTNPWHACGTGKRTPASHGCTRFTGKDWKYILSIHSKLENSRLIDF